MSEPKEDDLDALPEGELLTLPDGAIPRGWLSEFFARRAALIHQQDSNKLALELSGDSSLHLMIFRDKDPRVKRQHEEQEARRRAAQELQDYFERSDRLLARIDEQERVLAKRRREVEDNALKLHDGRRVYVDGKQWPRRERQYPVGQRPRRSRRVAPRQPPGSRKKISTTGTPEAERLRQKVQDRVSVANEKLTADEKEFSSQVEARAAQAPTDYGSSNYMADYGDEFQISTVPAFTKAAQPQAEKTDTQTDTEVAQTKMAPQHWPGCTETWID